MHHVGPSCLFNKRLQIVIMADDHDNGVSDAEMVEAAEAAGGEDDFFDHEPSRQEKMEVN